MGQKIKLTESQLNDVIKKIAKSVLKEDGQISQFGRGHSRDEIDYADMNDGNLDELDGKLIEFEKVIRMLRSYGMDEKTIRVYFEQIIQWDFH
jgi:hypothetical protein